MTQFTSTLLPLEAHRKPPSSCPSSQIDNDFPLQSPPKRLPSRRPGREDVVSALESTRLESGRINKTRAAQYLGWDPDTLVARMQDLGIAP